MAVEDVKKLPPWAQSKIQTLEANLRAAKEEVAHLKDSPPSNTIVGWENAESMGMGKTHYLKNNARITFKLPKGKLEVSIKDDVLSVYSRADGMSGFCVIPRSTSTLELKFID